jgi:hypothetical protein
MHTSVLLQYTIQYNVQRFFFLEFEIYSRVFVCVIDPVHVGSIIIYYYNNNYYYSHSHSHSLHTPLKTVPFYSSHNRKI